MALSARIERSMFACASSPRARIAAVVPGAAGLPRMLGGITAQNWPVAMQVPAAGNRIVLVGVGLSMQCRSGASFGTRDFMADVRIRARGAVRESRRLFPQRFADGGVLTASDSLNGQFNRDRTAFSGVWHLHFEFAGPHNQTDSCDSGQVHLATTL